MTTLYLEEKDNIIQVSRQLLKEKIKIEYLKEVLSCLGRKLINIQINTGDDAYTSEKEIMLEFDNGKEWRIYIDDENQLSIYSD